MFETHRANSACFITQWDVPDKVENIGGHFPSCFGISMWTQSFSKSAWVDSEHLIPDLVKCICANTSTAKKP